MPLVIDRAMASSRSPDIQFDIERVQIEGAKGLSAAEIEVLTTPFVHRTVSLAALMDLTDRISAAYAAKGFALTVALIPEQTIENGIVRIVVVEGTVDQIDVEFKRSLPVQRAARIASVVRQRLRGLVRSGPVRTYDLERSILGIEGLSGISPSIIIRPSKTIEGAADLLVVIDTKPLDLDLSADRRLRPEFGSQQAGLTLSANGLALIGDRLDLSYRRGKVKGAYEYRAVGYSAPLGNSLASVHLSASQTRTKAMAGFLSALEFEGLERTGRVGVEAPLYRARARSLYLNLDLAALDSSSNLFGSTLIKDRVRTVDAGLTYDWADQSGASSLLELSYVKGLKGLEATDSANPLRSRAHGSAEAAYVTARLYRHQPLGGFDLKLDVRGQVVTRGQSLWASAECSYGGQAYGRGFDSGLIGADSCLLASLELSRRLQIDQYTLSPYIFADGARVGQNGPLEYGEVREAIATSAGFGLRVAVPQGLSLDVQYARPQENPVPSMRRDGRWFLSLDYRY